MLLWAVPGGDSKKLVYIRGKGELYEGYIIFFKETGKGFHNQQHCLAKSAAQVSIITK